MRRLLLLLAPVLLLSCAHKERVACPGGADILERYSSRFVPENFRVYGIIRYGPLKLPMMLARFDGFYTVRVARTRDVSVYRDRFCVEGRCFLLPIPPEDLLFGRILSGREIRLCEDGVLVFEEGTGVYLKRVVFEGSRPREILIWNTRKKKGIRVLLGEEDEKGFFREVSFDSGGVEVKLQIEEVEL